jgi:SSS family solute:Na+ symporter
VGSAGGWQGLAAQAAPRTDLLASAGPASGWRLLFLLGPAFIVSPGLLQRAYAARDERAATRGIALNGLALMVFACAPAIIGMAAHHVAPNLARADLALPTLLSTSLHPALGSLALAAVFSAEVSSADAVLFMLATSASRDLYRGFVNPGATERQILRVARGAAIAGAACGVGVALAYGSVRAAVSVFYAILTVTLFVPVIGALVTRRTGRNAGLAAVVTGVGTLLAVYLATGGKGYGVVSPALAGVLASGVAFSMAHLARRSSTL